MKGLVCDRLSQGHLKVPLHIQDINQNLNFVENGSFQETTLS